MIVADSSVWIDYGRHIASSQTAILKERLATDGVLLGDLIITEVLQGIRDDTAYERTKRFMHAQPYHSFVSKRLAYLAAENYRILRKKGVTIRKTIDMLIGTYCIVNNVPLLHNDRDFDFMETHLGLKVIR